MTARLFPWPWPWQALAWLFAAALIAFAMLGMLAARDARALEVVTNYSEPVQLEINKGSLIRLDRPAASVFIANPEIADIQVKSPTLVYVLGKKVGETTLYAVDAGDRILANLRIGVSHNLSALSRAIAEMLPGQSVTVQSIDGTLVLEGEVKSPSLAQDLRMLASRFVGPDEPILNRVKVDAPTQVNLRVRVAEVSRSVVKQFGVNWDGVFDTGSFVFGLATGNPVIAAGSFLTRQNDANSIFAGASPGNLDLNTLVDALADEGLITVLAEPNLTALSGETASFLAGGEFPIPVPQRQDTITIEFKKFGVQLAFTPIVLDSGRISLRVNPEVSQLTSTGSIKLGGFTVPALTTRRAETTVELGSGQSFAIAGLLQNSLDHDVSKFPGLGDLPVLGALFRSDTFKRDESELVILVTPYTVRPVGGPALATPADGYRPPSDIERILLGHNYGEPGKTPEEGAVLEGQGHRLAGDVGFMLE